MMDQLKEAFMQRDEKEDNAMYKVVMNHEDQYSIWPAERENPHGWKDGGKSGTKKQCLDYVAEAWTDLRPLSLRRQMAESVESGNAKLRADQRPTTDAGT